MCGLVQRSDLPGPDLGFAMLPAFTGMGLAYEASLAVMELAATTFGLRMLYAITVPTNSRSMNLLRRLGFVSSTFGYEDPAGNSLNVYERTLCRPLQ